MFGRIFRQFPYFMCANSEGSCETVRMHRLAWAFTGRLCDKYHNLMSWLICPLPDNLSFGKFLQPDNVIYLWSSSSVSFEPAHEILALSVNSFFKCTCAAIQCGLDVWFLVGSLVYFHTSCVRTAKALVRRLWMHRLAWAFAGLLSLRWSPM